MKHALAALLAAGCLAGALSGCGGSQDCIVLALGGNKLCGSDAAAWCRSTDAIRQQARALGSNDQSSEETCQQIEQDNP